MPIRHIVLLRPKDATALEQIGTAMAILAQLPTRLGGMTGFDHGPNRDFERKSQDYPYGFICTFTDQAALETYAADPDHQRAGALLVGACEGGADGIFVADLEV